MPKDRPPGSGPYPLEPDTDEAPPTEEVLQSVVTEEVQVVEDLDDEPTDPLPRLNTEDRWYDPDAGKTEELPVGRKVAPWFALMGAFVLFALVLWGLGIVSLPGVAADGGKAACERTCDNLGTEVVRYSQDECVCARD